MHASDIGDVDHGNRSMIARIAEALDCSVDSFLDFGSNERTETSALLTSWHSIRDAGDREKVLAYVRTIAGKPPVS